MPLLALAVFLVVVAIAISPVLWGRWLWMRYQASHRAPIAWMLTTAVLLVRRFIGIDALGRDMSRPYRYQGRQTRSPKTV